ncbi:MAG: HYR domain-containing protein, partial [Gaiellaceae bacterium]
NIYIDPSGFVRTPGGNAIEGATVTLFRSDTGLPGTFVQVPDGSAIMSPANRTNPDLTDATGHFGWDVLAGYYLVRAEKADCGPAVESAVLTIPPPVTDLLLVLDCPVGDATPPVISVPGDIMSEATGPDGAAVTYSASAEDEVDGSVEVDCAPASGSTFPLGATVVTCTAEDAAGNVAEETFTVSVVDTTAPSLTVPADITVDATSPAGAVVTYSASAFDIVDGSVAPTCSPASGETFAIGDTTVTCTAEDAAGNAAEASFVVHVSGAGEQVADLIAASTGVGPGSSLADKARQVQAYLDAGQIEDACGTLKAYLNEVKAQTGKKVTAAQAATLAAQVNQIRAVLDC